MRSMRKNMLLSTVVRLAAMASVVYCSMRGISSRVKSWFGRLLEKRTPEVNSWGGALPVILVKKDVFVVKYDKAKEFISFLSTKQSWLGSLG